MKTGVVLVGAGHAHLLALRQADAFRRAGVGLTLIAPPVFRYSGAATGVLSGALGLEAMEVDVARLARALKVAYRPVEVTAVDRSARRLSLSNGSSLGYDAVSFNIGSGIRLPAGFEVGPPQRVWPVKPLANLIALHQHLREEIARTGRCPPLVVAGGGATGLEVAAVLAGLIARLGAAPDLTLVLPDPGLPWAPPKAAARLRDNLTRRGVRLVEGRVAGAGAGHCRLQSGEALACHDLVLATGLQAPGLMASLGLPTDARGRLVVGADLRAADDPAVFAAGDCAVIDGEARPFAGVFGVRAAPVLAANLLGGTKTYRPQRRWLAILDLGDGQGFARRGGFWSLGKAALAWKRALDRRFINSIRAFSARL
ncbi:NADH dehydrogenase FAD-containing subunit [Caulobacter ginsengisoli]|uniref:NADH dehydrogenase FAD-containing subunit n=1 Tax=Caulobacter ginsengisoli TaxID=400775 RepID=A0ABU0IQN2_9CAUL|nr:FAD-dependent oxidoreductase [Caulobacter ginsengisoli]MDQ0464320.1 NADH dehydrogenase FAD-containing subunit [Caulobacter ginsengisoli]